MVENANPFIRLGDDGENAPQLSYSVPESTNYVGTGVISIGIDEKLLNAETIKAIRENVEKKKNKKPPKPVPDDLKLTEISLVNRSENVGSVNTRLELKQVFDEHPSDFLYKPKESMLGFAGGFDIIVPRPRPPEKIFQDTVL